MDRPNIDIVFEGSEPIKVMQARYVEAVLKERFPPKYPKSRQLKAHAGMVEIALMVAKDGSVFEAIPLRSTHEDFEEESVKAVYEYRYAPATLGDTPVESRKTIRVIFEIESQRDAVTPKMHSLYRKANSELKETPVNTVKVRSIINKMRQNDRLNTYTLAQIAKLEVIFGQDHFSDEDYLEALQMFLLFEGMLDEQASFLPTELLISLKQKIIDLNLQLGRFAESVSEYEELALEDEQAASVFDQAIEQIRDLRKLKRSHAQNTKIVANRHTEISLIGDRVKLRSVTGTLEALKFRCSAKFFETPFELEKEYEIPDEWGHCHMEIVGEPGSTAEVIQSYSKA